MTVRVGGLSTKSFAGVTWNSAIIKDPLSQYTWILWTAGFTPEGKENFKIIVRTTDKTGQVQTAEFDKRFSDGANGYQSVRVRPKSLRLVI